MKMARKFNTVGALMIAAGAVATGASVTSGAMAADDAGAADRADAVIVGTASADGSGEAYQCVFDDLALPLIDGGETAGPAVAVTGDVIVAAGTVGPDGVEVAEGGSNVEPSGEAVEFQVTIGEDGSTDLGPVSGPLPEGMEPIEVTGLGVDGEGQVVMSVGQLDAEQTLPATAIDMSTVREGSPEECASLLEDVQVAQTATPVAEATPAVAP